MRALFIVSCVALANSLVAQTTVSPVTVPPIAMFGPLTQEIPVSATQAAFHVQVTEWQAGDHLSFMDGHEPRDSIRSVMMASAQQWLTQLQQNPARGLQLDMLGRVAVAAGQIALAEQQIAARLATPGLSLNDRAYTYLTAITSFTYNDDTTHLPIAERYLTELEALGPAAAYWQYQGHQILRNIYYQIGQNADVVRHGTRAVALVEQLEFVDRQLMYGPGGARAYTELVDVLSGLPDGRAKIDAINATLKKGIVASPELLARDAEFEGTASIYKMVLEDMMTTSMRVGTRADDIVGNYWMNMPTQDSQTVHVADGKVRILNISNYTCAPCILALVRLQRIQDRYPDIQVIGTAFTIGSWANRLVEPDFEAEELRKIYTGRLKLRFPVAVWKGTRASDDEDGITVKDLGGPNLKHYPMSAKSNTYVIDGKGVIRRVYVGYEAGDDAGMMRLLNFLHREANHAPLT